MEPEPALDFGRQYSSEHIRLMREVYSVVCAEPGLDGAGREVKRARRAGPAGERAEGHRHSARTPKRSRRGCEIPGPITGADLGGAQSQDNKRSAMG